VFLVAAVAIAVLAGYLTGVKYLLALLPLVASALTGVVCLAAAVAVQFPTVVGRFLLACAFPIFLAGLIAIVVISWLPALLYERVDEIAAADQTAAGALTVAQIEAALAGSASGGSAHRGWIYAAACGLWLLQFQLTRDALAALGVLGFVSLCAMFAIWWERKVAGRMQSRLGPMRVGGWHGWAQSLADGLKLFQKEDISLAEADRMLYRTAPYVAFMPALALFVALPFSAAWVCRDLDVGLIFIFAMLGLGVLGVLMAGWGSNNKWSLFGAMREACQMVSYEIPLGFSLLVPVMVAGTLRLTTIGDLQSGGFHTWLAFKNLFTFAAAVMFFVATLVSCKRAPFDLPEAESELVAGYHTEYSGFRWCLFFFAEYAEMFAVGALASILFCGAWNSPLPAAWGAAWVHGSLWQRALHGVLFGGPLWLVFKGFFFVYVQMWLRWTLPRIRLDQVMYTCVQVMLPLSMLILLANTIWQYAIRDGSWPAIIMNVIFTAVGAVLVLGFVFFMAYGLRYRRQLVGTLAVDHLPGA
jgi:NADH-quinone oxidoreductase subunit H